MAQFKIDTEGNSITPLTVPTFGELGFKERSNLLREVGFVRVPLPSNKERSSPLVAHGAGLQPLLDKIEPGNQTTPGKP